MLFLIAGILNILFGILVIAKPKILAYLIGIYLVINGLLLIALSIPK